MERLEAADADSADHSQMWFYCGIWLVLWQDAITQMVKGPFIPSPQSFNSILISRREALDDQLSKITTLSPLKLSLQLFAKNASFLLKPICDWIFLTEDRDKTKLVMRQQTFSWGCFTDMGPVKAPFVTSQKASFHNSLFSTWFPKVGLGGIPLPPLRRGLCCDHCQAGCRYFL